jgi:hypothetical protein
LKFRQQFSRQRVQQLATQVIGLLKHIGQSLVKKIFSAEDQHLA